MRKRYGFTLVELLVVIGIIALLIGILLPSLAKARKQATNVKCLANLHQIALAYVQYASANRGKMPVYQNSSGTMDPAYVTWQEQLRPYYGRPSTPGTYEDTRSSIRLCPEASDLIDTTFSAGIANSWGNSNHAWDFQLTNAPDSKGFPLRLFSSYAINGWVYNPPSTDPADGSVSQLVTYSGSTDLTDYEGKKLTPNGGRPAESPLIGDGIRLDAWPYSTDQGPVAAGYTLKAGCRDYVGNNMGRFTLDRHGRTMNMAFMDGHATSVPLRNLWNLNWNKAWIPPKKLPTFPAGFN